MSKTSERRKKWARILKAQASDSAGIAAGKVQLPANESRTHAKAGKHYVRATKNQRFAQTGERIYSTAQGCWTHAPNWRLKDGR